MHYKVINDKQTSGRRSLICPDLILNITVYRNGRTERNFKTFLPVRSPKPLYNFALRRRFCTPPLAVTSFSSSSVPGACAPDAPQPIGLLCDSCPPVISGCSHFRRQAPPRPYDSRDPSSERWNCGREFYLNVDLHI